MLKSKCRAAAVVGVAGVAGAGGVRIRAGLFAVGQSKRPGSRLRVLLSWMMIMMQVGLWLVWRLRVRVGCWHVLQEQVFMRGGNALLMFIGAEELAFFTLVHFAKQQVISQLLHKVVVWWAQIAAKQVVDRTGSISANVHVRIIIQAVVCVVHVEGRPKRICLCCGWWHCQVQSLVLEGIVFLKGRQPPCLFHWRRKGSVARRKRGKGGSVGVEQKHKARREKEARGEKCAWKENAQQQQRKKKKKAKKKKELIVHFQMLR